jgi:hypothetical protein
MPSPACIHARSNGGVRDQIGYEFSWAFCLTQGGWQAACAWAWKGRVVANLSCVSVAHPWRRVASQPPDEDALLVKNN